MDLQPGGDVPRAYKLTLTVNGTRVQSFSNVNKVPKLRPAKRNLSSYAGQTIRLKWTGTEDDSPATSFFVIDDTALNLS